MPSTVENSKQTIAHLERVAMVAESVDWEHVKASTLFSDQGFFSFQLPV